MTALGQFWSAIAPRLGIEVVAPFQVHLADGRVLVVDALVKNFGYKNGMLLVDDFSKIAEFSNTVVQMGYGFSTLQGLRDPATDSLDGYYEMLSDWTWSGPPGDRPAWVVDIPDDE